mgnify:CR=1 FL=1
MPGFLSTIEEMIMQEQKANETTLPPSSNTGVLINFSGYRYSIDWIRYSLPYVTPNHEVLPTWDVFDWQGETVTPLKNYNTAIAFDCGRLDWNTLAPRQKKLVTLTGRDLQELVNRGYGIQELLNWVSTRSGLKVSRLDFAIDVHGMKAGPVQVFDAHMRGECITRAKKAILIDATQGYQGVGQTCYIGTRESMKFLRIYDKAKEGGDMQSDWTRIEIELKDEYALTAVKAMARHGIIEAGKKVMRDYIMTGIKWFDDGVEAGIEGVYVDKVAHEPTDWEKWVLAVALPAVQSAIRKNVPGVHEEIRKTLKDVYFGHGTPGKPKTKDNGTT